MYCDQCGTLATPTAKYCHSCGHKLVAPDKTAEVAKAIKDSNAEKSSSPPNPQFSSPLSSPLQYKESLEPEKEATSTFHPWRRLFARTVDMALATPLLYLLLFYPIGEIPVMEFLLGTNGALWLLGLPYAIGVIFTVLFVPIEALFLCLFGATPGKVAFGLRVLLPDGARISFGQALSRSFGVFLYGLGGGIPLLNIFASIYSYRRLKTEGTTDWDDQGTWSIRCHSWTLVRIILCGVTLFCTVISIALTPPMIAKLSVSYWEERANLPDSAE